MNVEVEDSTSAGAVIQTRELLTGDYEAVLALWAQVDGVEIAEGDSAEEISNYLSRNPRLSRVAFDREQIVGAALCGHDGRRGFVYHLAVAPAYRGRKVGKRLVNDCVAGLRNAGILRAIILVARDNDSGRDFWRRNGWENLSEAVPMAKDLT